MNLTKNGNNENPFLSAKRYVADVNQKAQADARTWKVMGIAGMLMGVGGLGASVYQGTLPKSVPYIVEVDQLGAAVNVGFADRAKATDPRVIRHQLAYFITCLRTVTTDLNILKNNVFTAYAMTHEHDPASMEMQDFFKNDPAKRAQNELVSVEVNSVIPMSDTSWEVIWTETVYNRDGSLKEPSYHMRAMLETYLSPPGSNATQADITRNPLGIYVKHFTWDRSV